MAEHVLSIRFEVMQVLRSLKLGEREWMLRWMERLIANPYLDGDFEEMDPATGRKFHAALIGRHALYRWLDGPVKEIKVVDVRLADGHHP